MSFDLRLLITTLASSNNNFLSSDLRLLIITLTSANIFCFSSIYGFWLPVWHNNTFAHPNLCLSSICILNVLLFLLLMSLWLLIAPLSSSNCKCLSFDVLLPIAHHIQAVLVHRITASYYPPSSSISCWLSFYSFWLSSSDCFVYHLIYGCWLPFGMFKHFFPVLRVIASNYPFGNFKLFLFVFRFTAFDYLIVIFKFVFCPLSYGCRLLFGIFKHFVSVLQFMASNYRFSIFKVICLRFSLIVFFFYIWLHIYAHIVFTLHQMKKRDIFYIFILVQRQNLKFKDKHRLIINLFNDTTTLIKW